MKNTAKKIIAAVLAATTIFGSGMAAGSVGLVKASPLAITASAEGNQKTYKADGITYVCEMEDKGMAIISAEGDFPDDYTIPTKLGNINIKVLGHNAFAETNIRNITIPDSIVDIAFNAFVDCLSLDTVYFNATNCEVNTLTYAGITRPFMGSTVNTVYFGKGVTSVPDDLFNGAGNLENVIFNGKVTDIGEFAFYGCSSLKTIDLSNVIHIGTSAFDDCTNLSSVSFPKVQTIGEGAFANTEITSITIPKSVTSIGGGAFLNCNLVEIEFNAANCQLSNSIRIDSRYYGNYPSLYCNSTLTTITFGENVTIIPAYVCANMSSLETVEFKTKVTEIGDKAFYACSSITDVYFPGTESEWKKVDIKGNNEYLVNAKIHFKEEPQQEDKVVNVSIVDNAALNYKDTMKLNPEIETIGNPKYTVEFKSSNEKAVSVDSNGNVKATGTGTATVICTVTDTNGNTVEDTCRFNVSMTWWQWLIKIVLLGFLWY